MMPTKSISSCKGGFDPGPDLEVARTCGESLDPGPDLRDFDSVCDLGHCCSSFHGDPGPDVQLLVEERCPSVVSDISDVSEVSEQPAKKNA